MIIGSKLNFISRLVIIDNLISATIDESVALTDYIGAVVGYAVISDCSNAVVDIINAVIGITSSAVVNISVTDAAADAGVADATAYTALEEYRTGNIFKAVIRRAVIAVVAVISIGAAVVTVISVNATVITIIGVSSAVVDIINAVVNVAVVRIGSIDTVVGIVRVSVIHAVIRVIGVRFLNTAVIVETTCVVVRPFGTVVNFVID